MLKSLCQNLEAKKCAETWHFLVRSRQLADSLQIFKSTAKAVKGKEGLFQLFVTFQALGMVHRAGSNSPRRTVGTLGMANTREGASVKTKMSFPPQTAGIWVWSKWKGMAADSLVFLNQFMAYSLLLFCCC